MIRRVGDLHIWCVMLLHIFWACLLAGSKTADYTTPISGLTQSGVARSVVIVMLYLASTMAVIAVMRWAPPQWEIPFLVPQQFLLLMTAFGVGKAVIMQQYADGVQRPWEFILGDQLPIVALGVIPHTIVFLVRWREQARQWKA